MCDDTKRQRIGNKPFILDLKSELKFTEWLSMRGYWGENKGKTKTRLSRRATNDIQSMSGKKRIVCNDGTDRRKMKQFCHCLILYMPVVENEKNYGRLKWVSGLIYRILFGIVFGAFNLTKYMHVLIYSTRSDKMVSKLIASFSGNNVEQCININKVKCTEVITKYSDNKSSKRFLLSKH